MEQNIEKILFTEKQIQQAVKKLGEQLTADYHDKNPLVVGILSGATPFMVDLIRQMDCFLEIDFMDVSSYGDDTESSGNVKIIKDIGSDVAGRHVLIIEDIVDSGNTAKALIDLFASRSTASTKLCSLLDKSERRVVDIKPDYVGISTPNEFVVGYGLDYKQQYRNLPYIGVLKPAVYQED